MLHIMQSEHSWNSPNIDCAVVSLEQCKQPDRPIPKTEWFDMVNSMPEIRTYIFMKT